MTEGVVASPTFRPSRISSEAPEVVQAPEPTYQSSNHDGVPLSPRPNSQKNATANSSLSWREEEHEGTELETLDARHASYAPSRKTFDERKWRMRRVLVTGITVLVAFLVGGGIGRGVGVSVVRNTMNAATVTVTAPNSNPTTIVDYAGCPSVNNITYTSPTSGKQFLKICGMEILAPVGQNIDLGNSVEPTFNKCLDACAAKEGCVAATWYIFSASDPKKNSVCYFKDGLGNAASSTAGGQQLASGVLQP